MTFLNVQLASDEGIRVLNTSTLLKMVRGKSVKEDIRKIIVSLSESGKSAAKIGQIVQLSRYTIRNIIHLHKTTGSIAEKPNTGRKSCVTDINKRALRRIIKANRRSNFGELSVLWNNATGKCFSRATCHRTSKELGYQVYKVDFFQFIFTLQKHQKRIYFSGKRETSVNGPAKEE